MKFKLTLTLLLTSCLSHSAMLNNHGKGSFHIIPFFSTDENLNTQVTISNTAHEISAVKIHIKESQNGQSLLSYNVYLSHYDTWTFALGDVMTETGSKTVHASTDRSCPPFMTPVTESNPISVTTINDSPTRLKNGYIEIIEMSTADLQNTNNYGYFPFTNEGEVHNCSTPEAQFNQGGIWHGDATYVNAAMKPPEDSLIVEASIINVPQGTQYPIPVTTFSDFFEAGKSYHTRPDSPLPTLAQAKPQASLMVEGKLKTLDFDTGLEAVQTLLLKNKLETPYFVSRNVAALGSISLLNMAGLSSNPSCDILINGKFYHRSGYSDPNDQLQDSPFCNDLTLISLNSTNGLFDSTNQINIDGSGLTASEGVFEINFDNHIQITGTDSITQQQYSFSGLPIVGIVFNRATNANASPGLLAQYGLSFPIKGEANVTTIDNNDEK
ncbi:hypothetical protein [Marinicella rhabdoformis]|uniref:hypothetical protein n=1 Tax=Marinicella rhabdoformis TaxID=2580566 RepID=UPI0012AEC88D|nr:hypothetical protein [Marinicella rhabdoformis]